MTPSSSTTGLNGCSLTTTTSPPWSEHRLVPWCLVYGGVVSDWVSRNCLMSSSGTCWNTQWVWGSGCQPIPTTSLLYTAKEGKVKSKNWDYFFLWLFADCCNVLHLLHQVAQAPWSALGLLTVTSLRVPRYWSTGFLIILVNKLIISKWFPLVHQDSLEYFGERRTDKSRSSKFQGVETPSQVRTDQNVTI